MTVNKKTIAQRLGILALSATLMTGLFTLGASAAGATPVTAQLSPQLTITVDGVNRDFYTVAGVEAHPITYNGTTYLPIRAIGELMGKNVNWDQTTYTVTIGGARPPPPPPGGSPRDAPPPRPARPAATRAASPPGAERQPPTAAPRPAKRPPERRPRQPPPERAKRLPGPAERLPPDHANASPGPVKTVETTTAGGIPTLRLLLETPLPEQTRYRS